MLPTLLPLAALLLRPDVGTDAFVGVKPMSSALSTSHGHDGPERNFELRMALGDFTVELEKPLGIVLQEREGGGVRIKELAEGGAAATRSAIVPGDVLLRVNDADVSASDFDSVMDLIISLDGSCPARLTLGDGLGAMDMPGNVAKLLKTSEDAYFVDAVVREAVREIRCSGKLGDLLNVEVIIGAGVQDGGKKGQVRFFAIFSTDGGVTSYSCNVSATGIRREGGRDDDGGVEIISLSAAKDEGLGQTYQFI